MISMVSDSLFIRKLNNQLVYSKYVLFTKDVNKHTNGLEFTLHKPTNGNKALDAMASANCSCCEYNLV